MQKIIIQRLQTLGLYKFTIKSLKSMLNKFRERECELRYQSQVFKREIWRIGLEVITHGEGLGREFEIGKAENAFSVIRQDITRFRICCPCLFVQSLSLITERYCRTTFEDTFGSAFEAYEILVVK